MTMSAEVEESTQEKEPRMENNSYASTASGTGAPSMPSGPSVPLVAETGEPVSESQLKRVHSNYVPSQMEKHIEFLDFSNSGDLILGTSSLVTRYWIGQLWYYSADTLQPCENVTNPAKCLTATDIDTGVVAGRFIGQNHMVVGQDSGALVLVNLTKERDGDTLTHYLETQAPVTEHEDQLTGLDIWEGANKTFTAATVGQDLRLCVWGSQLELAHSYSPAHTRLISGVSCSPDDPHIVATAAQDGLVKIWDTRVEKPCSTVHRSSTSPPSTLTWAGEKLLVGTRCGALSLLDPKTPLAEPLSTGQFFDREVRRMRWDGDRKRLAVTADDTLLKVVEVRSGVVEVYKDDRHTDYVRGLAWKEDTLWSAGWDGKVFTHGWVPSHNQQ